MNLADYSAFERLRDGRQVEIRALQPANRGLREAREVVGVAGRGLARPASRMSRWTCRAATLDARLCQSNHAKVC